MFFGQPCVSLPDLPRMVPGFDVTIPPNMETHFTSLWFGEDLGPTINLLVRGEDLWALGGLWLDNTGTDRNLKSF